MSTIFKDFVSFATGTVFVQRQEDLICNSQAQLPQGFRGLASHNHILRSFATISYTYWQHIKDISGRLHELLWVCRLAVLLLVVPSLVPSPL